MCARTQCPACLLIDCFRRENFLENQSGKLVVVHYSHKPIIDDNVVSQRFWGLDSENRYIFRRFRPYGNFFESIGTARLSLEVPGLLKVDDVKEGLRTKQDVLTFDTSLQLKSWGGTSNTQTQ